MIVHDIFRPNGSAARSAIINYHVPFGQGTNVIKLNHLGVYGILRVSEVKDWAENN